MVTHIPRRPGTGSFDVERGGGLRTWLQTDHTGDKLLPNVLCSTGGTKSKSNYGAKLLFTKHSNAGTSTDRSAPNMT